MFVKLDADGSNAIDMEEMTDLFAENGINMSVEQIAEMFSVVKEINDKEWLMKNSGSSVYIPIINKHKVTLEDKLKLQLSLDDFHMVTTTPQALSELRRELVDFRATQRAQNNFKFIPVTMDELMFRFCTTEKRKEIKEEFKGHRHTLLKKNYLSQSNEDLEDAVKGSMGALSKMIGETNGDFSRFKNVQNRIYLKLLEQSV